MTTSEEICKLIGRKPQYKFTYLIGDELFVFEGSQEKCLSFIQDMLKRTPINGKQFKVIDGSREEVFPDLTKPANFVKVLECKIVSPEYNGSIFTFLIENACWIENVEMALNELKDHLEDRCKNFDEETKNSIKQALQALELEY